MDEKRKYKIRKINPINHSSTLMIKKFKKST